MEQYKVILVANAYTQVEGIDYIETFLLVAKNASNSLLLVMAVVKDWENKKMDVKTMFLHGELKEEIYMEHPKEFAISGRN